MSILLEDGTEWTPSTLDETREFAGKRPAWKNLADGQGCAECDAHNSPVRHFGSPMCRSFGIAVLGGWRTHCTCDACF